MGEENNTGVDDNWRISDSLWERIEVLMPAKVPRPKGGRPRVSALECMDGIFYVLRTGCQWKALLRSGQHGARSIPGMAGCRSV